MTRTPHVQRKRGVIITFSGVDGAGKTTLLRELAHTLEVAGHSVTRFHLYDDVGVFSEIRRIRRKWAALASRQAASERRGVPKSRPLLHSRLVTALLLPFDILLFARQQRRVLNRSEVLVIDRYFYDTLVDMLAADGWWGRILLRLMPRPDISVFVDVAPLVAFGRKGEFSVAELSRRADLYRTLFRGLSHCTIIPNEQLEKAREQLLAAVFSRAEDVMRAQQETLWR